MPSPSLAWFREAIESIDVGVTISDVAGQILYTNPAEARMHGYDVGDLVGRNVRVFADGKTPPRISPDRLRNARRWERETENRRSDGTRFPVRLLSDVLTDPWGEPVGLITICEDLTTARETEARLRQAQKMELLGQLTGGIAHDFNNVLTVILANMDLVAETHPANWAESAELIEETRRVARQGAALARQLLGFSRHDILKFDPIRLEEVLEEYVRVIKRVLPATIRFRIHRATDLPQVAADPHAVQQILLNLATNARDAMPEGGDLEIRVSREVLDEEFRATHGWGRSGEYVAVEVRDTGVGMDKAVRERLFEPFFTTKPEGKGTGLGMAMVYALMKQHRGFVNADSVAGRGTTITLWFPVERVSDSPAAGPRPAAPREVSGTETVLVVEDEASLRRAAERALTKHGYTPLLAADGHEGLALWHRHADRIRLVITDLDMPHLDGRALTRELRQAGCTVPIIVASGYQLSELAEAEDLLLLQKPWTIAELLETVRGALDQ